MKCVKSIMSTSVLLLLVGCASTGFLMAKPEVLVFGQTYPDRASDAHVDVFITAKPDRAYTEIASITCGDTNEDSLVDLGDVVYLLSYLYRNGAPPSPIAVGDVNVDSVIDIADVVYLLNYLFKDGPDPCE